jgi:outer membrane protein OmpA-like peptidoglycan-associated protein
MKISLVYLTLLSFWLLFIGNNRLYCQCPEGMITSTTNLVKNGDFSMGDIDFKSDYQYVLDVNCGNHWLHEGKYSILPSPRLAHCHFADFGDHTNGKSSMLVVNGATLTNQVIWKQTVNVMPNTTYYFSTWIANALNGAPSHMEFSINGNLLGEPIVADLVAGKWKQFFTLWNSENNTSAQISILNKSTVAQGNDFILDDIVFYTCEKSDLVSQLKTAKLGSVFELREVYFDTGSDVVKEASNEQLEVLVNFLLQHPLVEIEIKGHTDNVGNANDNLVLSEKRAKKVQEHLLKKSISKSRLKYIGYGEKQPITENETFEGKQKNRRVEFVIIKM